MKIRELANEEEEIYKTLSELTGTIEEKTNALMTNGIYNRYIKIHKEYTQLAIEGNIEALKRVFFLQWISSIEPGCFTGIPDGNLSLDIPSQYIVLKKVESLITNRQMDDEFEWMLNYAYCIVEWYFEKQENIDELKRYLHSVDTTIPWIDYKSKEKMNGRGQMGLYYKSIIESNQNKKENSKEEGCTEK